MRSVWAHCCHHLVDSSLQCVQKQLLHFTRHVETQRGKKSERRTLEPSKPYLGKTTLCTCCTKSRLGDGDKSSISNNHVASSMSSCLFRALLNLHMLRSDLSGLYGVWLHMPQLRCLRRRQAHLVHPLFSLSLVACPVNVLRAPVATLDSCQC